MTQTLDIWKGEQISIFNWNRYGEELFAVVPKRDKRKNCRLMRDLSRKQTYYLQVDMQPY